jgi:thymidylate synthase
MIYRYMSKTNKQIVDDVLYDIPRNQPMLILNPEKTNFFDMTIDDFTMVNYDPIKPQLKLELGI